MERCGVARAVNAGLILLASTLGSGATAQADDFAAQRAQVAALAKLTTAPAMQKADGFESTGNLKAIVHGVAAFGDDLVGKAFGEIENAVGILDEIAVRRNDAIAFLGAEVFLQSQVSEGAG